MSLLLLGALALSASASPVRRADWTTLNSSLVGRLQIGTPLALPCFTSFNGKPSVANATACAAIQANYEVPDYRKAFEGAYMLPQWEGCQRTGDSCLLDPGNQTASLAGAADSTCELGSISPYFFEVETVEEIQTAFAFAKTSGVPLAIKSSGHDYKGHSSGKGSLGLWVRPLSNISYSAEFVPEGCPSNTSYSGTTVGSGAGFEDVYAFADTHNITVVGGYAGTVSASGGWVQGGGHSVLSPVLGLGVDRVLQYRLVTPDGEYRVANECQNEDLFWALRGGGGGTFGVVLDATHTAAPTLPLQVAAFQFNRTGADQFVEFYSIIVNNTDKWAAQGWGGHVAENSLVYVNPLLDLATAQASMAPLTAWTNAQNGSSDVLSMPSWQAFNTRFVVPDQVPVGYSNTLSSGLIPRAAFQSPEGRQKVLDLLTQILVEGGIEAYIPAVGPPSANGKKGATSVTPTWYESVWELVANVQIPFGSTPLEVKALYAKVHDIAGWIQEAFPDSGAYMNESEVYQTNFTMAFWGDHYPRLLSIKNKYDPSHLLDVWQGVGWKGASDPQYQCYFDLGDW